MNAKRRRISNKKLHIVFIVLYLVGFLGASIIGLLSNSFFAYKAFNSPWADGLFFVLMSVLYITAFASEVHASHRLKDIVANAFIFLGSMTFVLLVLLLGRIGLLLAEIYSLSMAILIAVRFAIKVRKSEYYEEESPVDAKPAVAVGSVMLFAMGIFTIKFVSEIYFAWALIPAAVLTVAVFVIAVILLKGHFGALFCTHYSKALNALRILGVGLMIFFAAFFYSATVLATVNCVFDGEPTPTQYAVTDKRISSGARQITEFKIKVAVDGKDFWVNVPTTDYYELEIGDTVTLNYHKGALGFAYWIYAGNGSQ